jgi:L-seryl-tRNA(Ser) seleniumtransferase
LQRIRKNPLFRALRVDKLTIAALEATARLYLREDYDAIPALRMIRASAESIGARAERLASRLSKLPAFSVSLESGESVAGGGSTPGQGLATTLICLSHAHTSAEEISARLRRNHPPVIVRLERDQVRLDLRTVLDEREEGEITRALEWLAGNPPEGKRGS